MPGVKERVIELIRNLPEDVTIDDVLGELYFKAQVDAGLAELDAGRSVSHDEVQRRMSKWLFE